MNRKDKPIYGLKKVPDRVFTDIAANEIKSLKFTIGTLEAYIMELEHYKTKYELKFKPEFQQSELCKDMRNQINNLESKIKKLTRDNEKLILQITKKFADEKKC